MRAEVVEYSARSGNSETQEAISWPRALEAARLRELACKTRASVFTDASLGAEAAAFLRATQQSCALFEAIR